MPFDAYFLTAVVQELSPILLGARIDKIQQPSRDTVLLQLRGREKLLLSANVNRPRIHLTQASFDNPAQPPMFCMLLRKHLSGGRISEITQPTAERVVRLSFDCTDEMGVPCRKELILELMGRNSNLILTGADGRILDCLRLDIKCQHPACFAGQPTEECRIPSVARRGIYDKISGSDKLFEVFMHQCQSIHDSPPKCNTNDCIIAYFLRKIRTFPPISPVFSRKVCYNTDINSLLDGSHWREG